MSIMQRLGLVKKTAEITEIINAPAHRSVRDAVNRFAAGRPQGFIDEELYRKFPDVTPSQLRTRRNELWRDGLIVKAGRAVNAAGGACTLWLHAELTGKPVEQPILRPTYNQINQRLKTAQLELEVERRRTAALVQAIAVNVVSQATVGMISVHAERIFAEGANSNVG